MKLVLSALTLSAVLASPAWSDKIYGSCEIKRFCYTDYEPEMNQLLDKGYCEESDEVVDYTISEDTLALSFRSESYIVLQERIWENVITEDGFPQFARFSDERGNLTSFSHKHYGKDCYKMLLHIQIFDPVVRTHYGRCDCN